MGSLLKTKSFMPYLTMVLFNASIDLGHKIIIQSTVINSMPKGTELSALLTLLNALLLIPFVLAFSPAGFIADKFAKAKVLRITAASAIPMTLLLTFFYYQGWFWGAFGMTLVLATQATFNSPAKYGYIKEAFGSEKIAPINAAVQTVVILGILVSSYFFGDLFHVVIKPYLTHLPNTIHHAGRTGFSSLQGHSKALLPAADILHHIAPLGFILVGLSLFETWMTFKITSQPASAPNSNYSIKQDLKGHYIRGHIKRISSNKIIFAAIIGLSLFWGVNQLVIAEYPAYFKIIAPNKDALPSILIFIFGGVGILIGAIVAGIQSKKTIKTNSIPVACVGLTISLILLVSLKNLTLIYILFLIFGFLGGLILIPLNSLIQYHAKDSELGKIMAANNFMQYVFMLSFLLISMLLITEFKISVIHLFWILSAIAAGSSVFAISSIAKLKRKNKQ
jgi:acyl-[acyl-carrier-protein]-phospholipid O-acyltransferase / long-chain-fatty-acid--[acyl-carrier-protein] ligase